MSREPMNVYILQHEHELPDGDDDVKLIGVYSSEHEAEKAIGRLATTPGFQNNLSGFTIDEYEVDKDHWSDGFATV